MTEERFVEIQKARSKLNEAVCKLAAFQMSPPSSDRERIPRALSSSIDLRVSTPDGGEDTRRITLPPNMVKFLYTQELNRLTAEVFHLRKKFESM